MGDNYTDRFKPEKDNDFVARLNTLPKLELYKIWLEINGYPKKVATDGNTLIWRTPRHKCMVALDFSLYSIILPAWIVANLGSMNFVLWLTLVPLLTLLIAPRLPDNEPWGVVGLGSWLSNLCSKPVTESSIRPPSIIDVNVYTMPVMLRAAEKMIEPAISDIRYALAKLNVQAEEIRAGRQPLYHLKDKIDLQIAQSDADWRAILRPKLEKIERLIAEDNAQLADIEALQKTLNQKQTSLAKELAQLRERKEIIEQMEAIEELQAHDSAQDASFQRMMHDMLATVSEAQTGLHEARNIATAHEQAKVEIAQLLEQ